jgi:hypothetical protein
VAVGCCWSVVVGESVVGAGRLQDVSRLQFREETQPLAALGGRKIALTAKLSNSFSVPARAVSETKIFEIFPTSAFQT